MFRRKRLPYQRPQRLGAACSWLVTCLTLGGTLSIVHGVSAQQQVTPTKPIGEIAAARPAPPSATSGSSAGPATRLPTYLPYAEPTKIELPTIGVMSDLISVGKTPEGTMEVPAYPNFDKAAWYRHSPAPGQYGSSIIIGHVDSYARNAGSVFFNLAKLKLGDVIRVSRSDGTIATFNVRAIRDYGKTGLPHDIIYGPVTESAELRLITCSGNFNQATQSYDSNTVVFATLAEKPD